MTWQDWRSGSGTIFGSWVDAGTGAAGAEFQIGTAGGTLYTWRPHGEVAEWLKALAC